MKKFILLLYIITNISFAQNNLSDVNWEGNWWSGNVNMGSWFPQQISLSDFSKNDFSWGQIRTINQISTGTSINIETQILNSSGGVNYDAAYFGISDGWVRYSGVNYGIAFYDGKISFYENNDWKDSIGFYNAGDMMSISLTYNNNGSLTVQCNNFLGTYTPVNSIQNPKWIIASKDSRPNQGFYLKSIDGIPIINLDWEGNWWSGNVNMGSWFPQQISLSDFSKNDFSWGQIRTINQISTGTSINIETQILNSSGGVNYDAAYFGISDGWVRYSGVNYGIAFYDGKISFYENNDWKDSIGFYNAGDMMSISLTYNNNGSLTVQCNNFLGTYTPVNSIQNPKWIIASKDSRPNQGFYLKSIDGIPTSSPEDKYISTSIRNFSLSQNYPNPFNPSTKIAWQSAISGQQSLKVYNILGKEVATLVDEYRGAGDYEINFDSNGFPSGVYFYQIKIENFVETKKMILLK